jgi:hypothetical protein
MKNVDNDDCGARTIPVPCLCGAEQQEVLVRGGEQVAQCRLHGEFRVQLTLVPKKGNAIEWRLRREKFVRGVRRMVTQRKTLFIC